MKCPNCDRRTNATPGDRCLRCADTLRPIEDGNTIISHIALRQWLHLNIAETLEPYIFGWAC